MGERAGGVGARARVRSPWPLAILIGVLSLVGWLAVPTVSAPAVPVLGASAAPLIPLGPAVSTGTGPTGVQLRISVAPTVICDSDNPNCPADERTARVTLTAAAPSELFLTYPAVQVVFLLETTVYDGAYDSSAGPPSTEACADSSLDEPCEESNALPFFLAHAGQIAGSIADANSHSQVTFGLVDYFSTNDAYDDAGSDLSEGYTSDAYNVDIGSLVPAGQFQQAVASTFQDGVLGGQEYLPDSDFADNMLHSDSITALYGALMGYGIDWNPDAHHVIVLITSTAPRDPEYVQDYCISPSVNWRVACYGGAGAYSSGCEPSYDFGVASSPNCEGWVNSQTADPEGSIAGLTRTSPDCTDSLGHRCTIDVIDLWTTTTDPYSNGWPTRDGGGPGGTFTFQNTARVLEAGCDLAEATGGSWDGPDYYACPDGVDGDLGYVPYGTVGSPDTSNPSLLAAFGATSFGPQTSDVAAWGGNESLFHYVPFANVRPAVVLDPTEACLTPNGPRSLCPAPTETNSTAGTALDWNWSTTGSENNLETGDEWIASFNVAAYGPPYGYVPVDACTTAACASAGSGSVALGFTSVRYLAPPLNASIAQSFGVAEVRIQHGALNLAPPPPSPASGGSEAPIVVPPTVLGTPPILAPNIPPSVPTISVQALGAGFLGAGFTRIAQKNRPVAVGQANSPRKSGGPRRRPGPPPRIGRFV